MYIVITSFKKFWWDKHKTGQPLGNQIGMEVTATFSFFFTQYVFFN